MGAFFIVIIMLVYILGRCNYEQAVARQSRKEYAEKQRRKEETAERFKKDYTDPALEKKLKDDSNLRARVKEQIYKDTGIYDASNDMIMMIAMAEYGKVPEKLTQTYVKVFPNFSLTRGFMVYYDMKLRYHGMKEEIKICSGFGTNCTYYSIYTQDEPKCGYVYWWPAMYEMYPSPMNGIILKR